MDSATKKSFKLMKIPAALITTMALAQSAVADFKPTTMIHLSTDGKTFQSAITPRHNMICTINPGEVILAMKVEATATEVANPKVLPAKKVDTAVLADAVTQFYKLHKVQLGKVVVPSDAKTIRFTLEEALVNAPQISEQIRSLREQLLQVCREADSSVTE